MKFKLWFPTDNFRIEQKFGKEHTVPFLLPLYKKYGLIGHNGLDLLANDGEVIRAAHTGTIISAGGDSGLGLFVAIRTNETFEYKEQSVFFKTIYGHLKYNSIRVRINQIIRTGDIIALADNTGASTGSHLHFGLKPQKQNMADQQWENLLPVNGYEGAIDPFPYFTSEPAKNMAIRFNILETLKRIHELYKILLNLKGR